MRRLMVGLFAAAFAAAPLAAQSWHPEIGVQGGFARLKPAGTAARDQIDEFDIPATGLSLGALGYNALFAVIPLHQRFALEPSFAATQSAVAFNSELTARIGVRADYAITPHFYAALGAEVIYRSTSTLGGSDHVGPLAVQAAAGYRFGLTSRLNGRVEAHWAANKASNSSGPSVPALDVYGLLIGVSAPLDGATAPRGARRPRTDRAWEPALGIVAGYTSGHIVGGPTLTALSFPGFSGGAVLTGLGGVLPLPATVFAIIPVGGKLAVEPGLNFERTQQFGAFFQTLTATTLSVRADYAVGRAWYAGLGPVADYIKATNFKGAAQMGVTGAWGYRFHVTGDVGGRLEASYSLFAKHRVLGVGPTNVLFLGGAVTMAL